MHALSKAAWLTAAALFSMTILPAHAETPPAPNSSDVRIEQRNATTDQSSLTAVPGGCGDVDGVSTEFVRVTARHSGEFDLVVKGEPVGRFRDLVDQSFPTGEGAARIDLIPVEGSGRSVSLNVPDVCNADPDPAEAELDKATLAFAAAIRAYVDSRLAAAGVLR